MATVTIYHNPHCSTSRKALEPIVVTARGARLGRPVENILDLLDC